VEIPFASYKHASIAKQVIEVDAELSPQAVIRELSVHNNILIAYAQSLVFLEQSFSFFFFVDLFCLQTYRTFHTLTVRLARITLNAFLGNVDLVVRTIDQFGAEAEKRGSS
jgi:EKC/KEOPS complex subunit PCC1/LAGE3